MRTTASRIGGALIAATLATVPGPASGQETGSDASPGAIAFHELETRLLEADSLRLDYEIVAEGAVEVRLQGGLDIGPGGRIELHAAGTFAGQSVDLRLAAEDGTYAFGNGPGLVEAPTPPHLREALVIGLTRMGILHNLARLSGNAPPDRAEGGVREWVETRRFAVESEDPAVVAFEIVVSGQTAGSASLTIDPDGRPVVRRQTVQFPSGEMRVVERYTGVSVVP